MTRHIRVWLLLSLWALAGGAAQAMDKVAVLSTRFVLERKFQLIEEAARARGVQLAWTQVDRDGEAGVRRALDGARLVVVDAPRGDDQAQIERVAGALLRERALPTVGIHVMSPPSRLRAQQIDGAQAQRLFDYWVGGTRANHERLAAYLRTWLDGGDLAATAAPVALPASGIYHPGHAQAVVATLPDYLAWWAGHAGSAWQGRPVVAMEISSSYLADGQTRMLDDTIQALERAGAVPLVFYRGTRAQRPRGARGADAPVRDEALDEPLLALQGRLLPQVMVVNTFLGTDPDGRRAWHRAMGIPVINLLHYRTGDRRQYARDTAGVSSFYLPFTLTSAEYIGLQDPVLLTTNEGGELVPLPEQMDLLVGKCVRLARLALASNADKRVALLFWNHPPGEKNQGASHLNVPRSIEHVVARLRAEGYAFDAVSETQVIDAVAQMLRPAYRHDGLGALMQTPHWDFLPLAAYQAWLDGLPAAVRQRILDRWGAPSTSAYFARWAGEPGFVVPRMRLGQLVVMPQMSRGESMAMEDEKKLFHDNQVPPNHAYLAQYLWIRTQWRADAIVHFGTHGTQEWTPGKERGLWAYDDPNLLVGNVPVIYPYIVDNIGEAVHVKRRGRGVIVSHQTPALSPAGLSDDLVQILDAIREHGAVDEGPVKEAARQRVIELALRMQLHRDLQWDRAPAPGGGQAPALGPAEVAARVAAEFPRFLRELQDHLEELSAAQQPLGLHTLGRDAEPAHLASTVMQMLGQPLYAHFGFRNAQAVFLGDYRQVQQSAPYRFVQAHVLGEVPLPPSADDALRELAEQGRRHAANLRAEREVDGLLRGLAARWIDPSYGGDPVRNPDALPTGRNMYGFDPGRVPTPAAYEAGVQAVDQLVRSYQQTHGGRFPDKLAFSMWSTETMRHLGMLEAQVLWAMGVRPVWDAGGRVTGMEVVPLAQLGRPRIDVVISLTGLYRDQFPNVMERFNEAIGLLARADEPAAQNPIRANTERIREAVMRRGVAADEAQELALTRLFGNESGDYGTKLPDATLASDRWDEGDGRLQALYLSRMGWAYGPDPARWSRRYADAQGAPVDAYAEHLKGTRAAVFSRSSNLRGLLDTDHPFEYLGGISMAVRHLDGQAPQLYISNMRDPQRARLETAERFLANELRAVYHHPGWLTEMKKEGYAGTLQLLNTVNNFWGWQVMDRQVVRDDQWQAFHDTYVRDRHGLGLREWFERSNPTALAQVAERMLEAIRKGYWQADEATQRELVQTWTEIAARHDVHTSNEVFQAHVARLAAGYGLGMPSPSGARPAAPTAPRPATAPRAAPPLAPPPAPPSPAPDPVVRGQQLREVPLARHVQRLVWAYGWLIATVVLAGIGWQAWRTRRELDGPSF